MILFSHTTGIHYTDEIVEWAVLRKNRKGTEKIREGSLPVPPGFFQQADAPLFPTEVLAEIRRNFRGVVTVSLPSSQLLMRMLELPSTNPQELKSMVDLQMDQISPFPVDQLTVSYEVLHQSENHSRVLAVAAQRKTVDALGDLFKAQNVYIRSLDAEVLAWWSLLIAHGQVPCQGRVVLILEEHTEFSMIVVDDGVPVCFRSLELFHDFTDEAVMHEIVEEMRYTLLSLEAEYGRCSGCALEIWSESDFPEKLVDLLRQHCGGSINLHRLDSIPPVSEGLALRTAERRLHHAELVPREWIDLQRRKRLIQVGTIASITVLSIWLAVITITGAVFSFQQAAYNRVRKEAARYEGPARAAQAAREEMLSLERYADRSRSALECLREVTAALPDDVELASFTYKKGEAISLRGSSGRAEAVYDFFQNLGASKIFSGVKDQPVSTRMVKDRRVSTFSITAELPKDGKAVKP
ncbi:MAG: PilN domain-containing protein [Verrucomicrobia bacterium]|nr:PilN domain-containing protein [Verrucomicrobiota bacterium]